jgi:hypothetical protein
MSGTSAYRLPGRRAVTIADFRLSFAGGGAMTRAALRGVLGCVAPSPPKNGGAFDTSAAVFPP